MSKVLTDAMDDKGLGIIGLANQCGLSVMITYQSDNVVVRVGGKRKTFTFALFDQLEPIEILQSVTGDKRWQTHQRFTKQST